MDMEKHPLAQLLEQDRRYRLDAYQFVRDGLDYAHHVLGMGSTPRSSPGQPPAESHLTGQELCEALRQLALKQYGFLAKWVLSSWGVHATSDFGELVYNMIAVNMMRKSNEDRREDFDDVYEFDEAFVQRFRIDASP